MRLKFPISFDMQYPEENLSYYTGKDKSIILDLLMPACNGYCMYCGKNIKVDDKEEFNIEHSLEKSMNIDGYNFLENCKFNLSIACHSCNQKYKTRMIDSVPKEFINHDIECLEKKSVQPCDKYINIFNIYIKLNNIILQPNLIDSNLQSYSIEYNLIKHIFEPGQECINEMDREFISNHIARFHLNREMYTKAILKVSEDLCNKIKNLGETIPIQVLFNITRKERYDNVLEKIYIEFLEVIFQDTKNLYEYCKFTLVLSYL